MPACVGVIMAALYDTEMFVIEDSLEISTVEELTAVFVEDRGTAMPILEDRDECGDDQLWCDLVSPSAGHMLMWEASQSYTQETELHWTGSTASTSLRYTTRTATRVRSFRLTCRGFLRR